MRILCFTDTHAESVFEEEVLRKAKNVDLIICAGDFSLFGSYNEGFFEKLDSLKKPFLFIDGTHETRELCIDLEAKYDNFFYIHDRVVRFGDFYFAGFGDCDLGTKNSKMLFRKLKDAKNLIFVSHTPPFGTELDKINGEHLGDLDLAKVLYTCKPKFYICGHFHENFGKKQIISETILINPGPWGEIL